MSEEKHPWCPDRCPITMRPFFLWMEHPDLGDVPTYGGPYDSYTIPEPVNLPEKGEMPYHDIEFEWHRYDHDSGCWSEIQMCDMRIVKEEVLCELGAWGE